MCSSRRSRSSPSELAVREIVEKRAGSQWCLFLDRDGVINRRIVGDYVRNWQDFEWLPGAPLALKKLWEWAPYLVVVTNQQGIGKGLMSFDDVVNIHQHLRSEIAADGVVIDEFAVCPHLASADCACRKPRPGLVLDWLGRHPEVDPSLSVIAGDSLSDLELARNVAAAVGGCASISIGGAEPAAIADASFDSLLDFALTVAHARGDRDS